MLPASEKKEAAMVSEDAIKRAYDAMKGTAEKLVGNVEQLLGLVEQLQGTLKKAAGALGDSIDDVATMGSMISDYAKGNYKEIPRKTIISITVAVVYVVSPIDLIPDYTPVVGYADDIALVGFVLSQVHEDVDAYREWKKLQND